MIVSNDLDFPSRFLKPHTDEIIACAVLFCPRPSRRVNFDLAFLVCFDQGMHCGHFLRRLQVVTHYPRHDDVVQVDLHGSRFRFELTNVESRCRNWRKSWYGKRLSSKPGGCGQLRGQQSRNGSPQRQARPFLSTAGALTVSFPDWLGLMAVATECYL